VPHDRCARSGGQEFGHTSTSDDSDQSQVQRRAIPLTAAVDTALTAWSAAHRAGALANSSLAVYARLLTSFQRFASAQGVMTLDDVDAPLCLMWLNAPVPRPSRTLSRPSTSTSRLRATVIRQAAQTWREAGLLATDIDLPFTSLRASPAPPRPLTPPEVLALRRLSSLKPDRCVTSACVASLLAGATQTEAAHIVDADYDPVLRTLSLAGRASRRPRAVAVGPEGARALDRRVALLRASPRHRAVADPRRQLLNLRRPLDDYALAAVAPAIGNTISRSLHSAGIDRPHVTAGSLRDYAANRMFAMTDRVEDVAQLLGLASLDRARRLVDFEWQSAWGDLAREDEG
jgi:site-specific recombinase XerD